MSGVVKERRIHKVFITKNTEYHVRRETCVAVRDRRSGRFLSGHMAINSKVGGGLRFHRDGAVSATDALPSVGESLFFVAQGRDLVTSAVVSIDRPEPKIVQSYV
jgi:hypothetical protein